MTDPQWRDMRPSRPYGTEPGGGHGRDTRAPAGDPGASRRDPRDAAERTAGRGDPRLRDPRLGGIPGDDAATRRTPAQAGRTQPIAPQPTFTPRPADASGRPASRPADGPGTQRGDGPRTRRGARTGRHPRTGSRLNRIWEGSLRGGLGTCVIIGSALIGAIATIATKSQPGSVLGLFVLAGTVAAALTIQPRSGRLIFPVPALSYLVAALAAGVTYDRSADKTQIAVGAAQWIADGFFVMVLATLLAIALTTVRWFMWRRVQRGLGAPDRSPRPAAGSRPQPGPPRPPGAPQGTQPSQWRPGSSWDQRPGPRPGQRPSWTPGQRPGSGPYNFSSGA